MIRSLASLLLGLSSVLGVYAGPRFTSIDTTVGELRFVGSAAFDSAPDSEVIVRGVAVVAPTALQPKVMPELSLPSGAGVVSPSGQSSSPEWNSGLWIVTVEDQEIYVAGSQLIVLLPHGTGYEVCVVACEAADLKGERIAELIREVIASHRRVKAEERQPNQALQTTPMTRSVFEKTIEFGHPQRGV